MVTVLLDNLTNSDEILLKQKLIFSYAKKNSFDIDNIEIETSNTDCALEERVELKGFLRSLKTSSILLIYDLKTLSNKIEELVKIFKCLLERNIKLHICSINVTITNETKVQFVLDLLLKQKAKTLKHSTSLGRPKGRISRSKFDNYRMKIIEMLELGFSVNKISSDLKLTRSSLKDYINSRGLKELAVVRKNLLDENILQKAQKMKKEKCDLIALKKE